MEININSLTDDQIIEKAKTIMNKRFKRGIALTNPKTASDIILFMIGQNTFESFVVIYLDGQNKIIEKKIQFNGSINTCTIHVRPIISDALKLGAHNIIIGHNHPTGSLSPSQADKDVTKHINDAAKMFEIRLLDHFIVTPDGKYTSFCERGLI